MLNVISEKQEIAVDTPCEYAIYYKSGGDGAGSQTVWKSKSTKDAAANRFQYSLSLLKLTMTKDSKTEVL